MFKAAKRIACGLACLIACVVHAGVSFETAPHEEWIISHHATFDGSEPGKVQLSGFWLPGSSGTFNLVYWMVRDAEFPYTERARHSIGFTQLPAIAQELNEAWLGVDDTVAVDGGGETSEFAVTCSGSDLCYVAFVMNNGDEYAYPVDRSDTILLRWIVERLEEDIVAGEPEESPVCAPEPEPPVDEWGCLPGEQINYLNGRCE